MKYYKMMKRFVPYVLLMLLSVSCIEDEIWFDSSSWSPSLKARYIYMADKEVPLESGITSFETYVEAEATPWKFSGQESWLTVDPLRGTDDTEVMITAAENMSGENLRTSLFWLLSDVSDYDYKSMVSVTQSAASPYLSISESSVTMVAIGESKNIIVDKNISYTISKSSSASWLSVTASADSTKLTIIAEPNPSASTRTATINLKGLRSQSISITQEAAGMTSDKSGTLQVGVKGEVYELKISSDAAWTASTSSSWFSVSPAEGSSGNTTVQLSVSPNNTTSERKEYLYFKIGSIDMVKIKIIQEGLNFTVTPTSLSMPAAASSRTLNVSSNTEWTVISKPSWITTDVESGSGNKTVTVTASEHTGREVRSGEIKLGVNGVTDLVRTVRVSQSQHYFNLSPSSPAALPSTGGIHKVSVASDDTWKVEKEDTWLTLSTNTGAGDLDVTMTAADNPSINERDGKVVFTPTYASPIDFFVKQAGRYLSVNTTQIVFYWRGGESLPVDVTTDGTFSVSTQCEWLNIEQIGHSFTLTVEEYDAEEPRSGVVTVALTGLVSGEAYSIDIPVVQRPNIPVDIITFPIDQNWDIAGNTHATVTITGYSEDESWDDWGDSSVGLNITIFGQDEDWNH